ncbi:PfkB family carbohydrate kinase [Janibacter melonis]|uniref:carbohydrate kinase family protein n=1 Tax=Janibacter melonis TaxID=262209 RepID=UPI001781C939|nr:carbohydrate kinase family protein [Janibacter melonis]
MLAVAGDLVQDVVVLTHEPLRRGSDVAAQVSTQRGGSAANVAAFAAASGTPTRFVGCVGDDVAGRALVAELAGHGVDVRVQERGTTGVIVVVVEQDGERTMYPSRGASALVESVEPGWLDGVEVLHLPLYGFDGGTTPDALHAAAVHVRSTGGRVCVDLSSTLLVDRHGAGWVREVLARVAPTWVSANADEVHALGLDDPAWLDAHPGTVVLARAGADPTRVLRAGAGALVVPVAPVDGVVDTTGAGDAFAAGFLGATLAGSDLLAAVAAGHALARRVVTAPGAVLPPA